MDLALAIAKTGLEAQHQNIEIISNNLANANTTAYKKSTAQFADLPYQVTQLPGSPITQDTNSNSGMVVGTGTKLLTNTKSFVDGQDAPSTGPLDIAIHGSGFLEVQLPNSGPMAFTRNGNLSQNEQGQLTDSNGYIIQPPITIPQGATNITFGNDGTVTATLPTGGQQQLGQLQLADFANPEGLQPLGNNLYSESLSSGAPTLSNPGLNGLGVIVPNALESSNVNVVEEMVNLIEAQRTFEVTSKAVSTVDNMMDTLEREI